MTHNPTTPDAPDHQTVDDRTAMATGFYLIVSGIPGHGKSSALHHAARRIATQTELTPAPVQTNRGGDG